MLVGFQNYTLLAGASAVVYNIIIGTTAFLSKYLQRNIITVATLYYILHNIILSHIDYHWFKTKHSYFEQILKKLYGE